MEDPSTNPELSKEISALKQRIKELEQSESQRQKAVEVLRESEMRYRELFDNISRRVVIL